MESIPDRETLIYDGSDGSDDSDDNASIAAVAALPFDDSFDRSGPEEEAPPLQLLHLAPTRCPCVCCHVFAAPRHAGIATLQLALLLSATALIAVYAVGYFRSHGFCILAATREPTGVLNLNEIRMPCELPLYSSVVVIGLVFTIAAVNWIAGLHNTQCWLMLETAMTIVLTVAMTACSAVLLRGFLGWCDVMNASVGDLTDSANCSSSAPVHRCHCSAVLYDEIRDPDEKMSDVYTFSLVETLMSFELCLLLCVTSGVAIYRCHSARLKAALVSGMTMAVNT